MFNPHVLHNEFLFDEPSDHMQRCGAVGPRKSSNFRHLAVGKRGVQRHITVDSPLCRSRFCLGDTERFSTFLNEAPWGLLGAYYVHLQSRPDAVSSES